MATKEDVGTPKFDITVINTRIRNVQKIKLPIKLDRVTSISLLINTFFIALVMILVNQSPANNIIIAVTI